MPFQEGLQYIAVLYCAVLYLKAALLVENQLENEKSIRGEEEEADAAASSGRANY